MDRSCCREREHEAKEVNKKSDMRDIKQDCLMTRNDSTIICCDDVYAML
jgi:hypothetical protein